MKLQKNPLFCHAKNNLLYLSMLSFIFIASFALVLAQKKIIIVKEMQGKVGSSTYADRPVLKDDFAAFPVFSGQAVLALDLDSGVTLYEKNPDQALLPASTTKIVTAMVAMDKYNLNSVLTVNGIDVDGQKMGLVSGEQISVKDLLFGLLVYSANDAAEVLAINYCIRDGECGREAFVSSMNVKAQELGLTNTSFTNPSGFDANRHRSTARDLVKVSTEAMKNPFFAQIVGTREVVVKSVDGGVVHKLVNINKLLGSVDGVLGVKTGWTENARENLVTYIEKDGRKIMIAIMGSQDRFGETEELVGWIYANYEWQDVVYTYLP